MTTISGWCLDERQALDLDRPDAAQRLHDRCRPDACTCPGHDQEEKP